MTSDIKGNLIGGAWVTDGAARPDINPSDTAETVGLYAQGGAEDVAAAVDAARAALPGWAHGVPAQRGEILARAASEVAARRPALAALLAREEGKTLAEATGEVQRAEQILSFFAAETLRLRGETLASTRPGVGIEITREPVGVVGIITPWNFPIAIPAWKIAPALAHGNCVVFKPADLTPACAWALTDILHRAGLPPGVLNLVMGPGRVVGQAMTGHPGIDAISFTGSVATGRGIAAAAIAASPMKKLQLEMGGKNPLVVLDDADLETAVAVALNGAFFQTGQRCTASSRLIVTDGIHDRFVSRLVEAMGHLRVGHALDPATTIGPVADRGQFETDLRYIDTGRREGARLAFGGDVLNRDTPGYFLQPALFTEATNTMAIAREEIFGPVACVIRVPDFETALAIANDTPFGLSAGICTTSLRHATEFRRRSEAGMVMVNLPTAGVDFHVPFGGRKASSHGPREQGSFAAEFFTTVKTAYTAA
ncbi:MAG: aldehyde dehydrogenase family protein [Rhodobacteraceae bacterium]|jgi:aldehyde dehydrogenase (NAD+)|nr:aldehyde dehydrogenase family protein [Paracoccaceae bacterium]